MRSKQVLGFALLLSAVLAGAWQFAACSNSNSDTGVDPAEANPAEPTVDATLPRVIGAASTGNTSVVVMFSKPMGDGAADPASYLIIGEDANQPVGGLVIMAAAFLDLNRTAVELTTLSQSGATYRVYGLSLMDQSGNSLAPKSLLVDPTSATFVGTPPGGGGPDTDADGLSDDQEQRGWSVAVVTISGPIVYSDVSSDPLSPDTDADGVSDFEEKRRGADPRDSDTDKDSIPDHEELSVWLSSLTHQDTDGDGIDDAEEVGVYKTSSIMPDTDGDGLPDGDEVILSNRDPRIADMPRPIIDIGEIALRLDTRFSFTDTQGVSQTSSESVSTMLTESETDTFRYSDANTTKTAVEIGVEAEYSWKKDGGFTLKGSFKGSRADEETITINTENSTTAQEAYQESLSTSKTVDQTQSVTREVVGANVQLNVTIRNEGDIAFTLSNLEVSALQQDIKDKTRFVPVATLAPAQDSAVFNLGPFVPEKGPFIFDSSEVFPSLVEDLLKNPRGLIFKVANFDLEDEFGRNFAFISQDVNDRTAGLIFDYGNGTSESFRVATAGRFDPVTSKPQGITMSYALQDILGLEKNPDPARPDAIVDGGNGIGDTFAEGDDVQAVQPDKLAGRDGVIILPGPNGVLDTTAAGDDVRMVTRGYSTELDEDGIERIVRVKSARSNLDQRRMWHIITNAQVDPSTNFDEIVLHGGDTYSLFFVQDKDADGLIDREEFLYGSSDLAANTDGLVIKDGGNGVADTTATGDDVQLSPPGFNVPTFTALVAPGPNGVLDATPAGDDKALSVADSDTLDDLCEVRQGWTIQVVGHQPYRGYSDPARPDSDADLLLDHEEFAERTDARKRDTDDDGIKDFDEVYEIIFSGADGVANSIAFGDDVQVIMSGQQTGPDKVVIRPGPNRVLQSAAGGDDRKFTGLDPLNPDTDVDGLSDGLEIKLGANPVNPFDAAMFRDTDNDGLTDSEETIQGWTVKEYVEIEEPVIGFRCKYEEAPQFTAYQCQTDADCPPISCFDLCNQPLDSCDPTQCFECCDPFACQSGPPCCPDDCSEEDCEAGTCSACPPEQCDMMSGLCKPACPSESGPGMCDLVHPVVVGTTVVAQVPMLVQVFSNPFEPDSDFDGLPDLLENMIATNPQDSDTDKDDLRDCDEFKSDSPSSSISPPVFHDFEDRCLEAPRCTLDLSNSAKHGTSLTEPDTDHDGLSDYAEIFDGWLVFACVANGGSTVVQPPEFVKSKPLIADEDFDSLSDGDEKKDKTHPRVADTDGDGNLDGEDTLPSGCKKNVTVKFTQYSTGTDYCDPYVPCGFGEFKVLLRVNNDTVVDSGCLEQSQDNAVFTLSGEKTIELSPGQAFTISGTVTEHDNGVAGCIEDVPIFGFCNDGNFTHEVWTILGREYSFDMATAGTKEIKATDDPGSDPRHPCFDDDVLRVQFTIEQ